MGKKRKRKKRLNAKTADRHALYQKSVQAPEFEVDFTTWFYKRRVGRKPLSLREDFCGTALLCTKWVQSDKRRTALGVDIERSVLDWGRDNLLPELDPDEAGRLTLVEGDVRDVHPDRHDVIVALNYSYFCFKTRDLVRGYFEKVRGHLTDDGLFFLDLFGGWESQQELVEKRKVGSFQYIWEQASFNPITADFLAHIHFKFGNGSKMKRAFTYDWRLWTLPELRELLAEAGFTHVEVLWEGEDEEGDGTGEFHPQTRVTNDPGFNAYLVASVGVPPRLAAKRKKLTSTG